ncbi:hypothetical protein LSTR_LSTR013777 [Laodelphax striatellus]|uniref:PDZ domain-containing protein n=1 Tax=Laodelphax striatellus TaxID=195883 RepID=A0A482WZZ0_LAOST|nr:hypothetical protein LSTR_LSTR013777 [Laodelphax striatellus]
MLCLGAATSQSSYHGASSPGNTANVRGDRLVSVNGQVVVNGDSARQLLDAAGEHVQLQLLRHGLHYKSLPGCRLSSHKKQQQPAAAATAVAADLQPAVAASGPEDQMGSNLSRSKGLTGRRSQSSGNLCNGKSLPPVVGRFFSPCGRESVQPHDRYKLCGSLPNHLDAQDVYAQNEPIRDERLVVACDNNNEPLKTVAGDLQLRLSAAAPDLDQGYGSGKSPDRSRLPLLTPENTFTVSLVKGSQGLGLSVAGGREEGGGGGWPAGLVRIKRLFPNQPAWQCGQLRPGDILLTANRVPLTGLTNYEALEILRTTPSDVELTVCRPPPEVLQHLGVGGGVGASGGEHPPAVAPLPPPRRDPHLTSHLSLSLKQPPPVTSTTNCEDSSFGEFDVVMTKVNGSLGFTLRKEDESVLGHYVRALVREPALSDGRIRPGDKIVAVNDVDMSRMTHEEAVLFLRQCGQEVRLRLYRDRVQTPVAALSPVQSSNSLHRAHKPMLRKEAQDMLSDLAVKKSQSQSPGDSISSAGDSLARTASPRKRRLVKTPSPDSCLAVNGGLDLVQTEPLSMPPLAEPVSMPPLLGGGGGSEAAADAFSYRNPAYRSANPVTGGGGASKASAMSQDIGGGSSRFSEQDLGCGGGDQGGGGGGGSKGLLKWKGVVFSPEEGDDEDRSKSPPPQQQSISQIVCDADDAVSSNQVLVVELNRGWNSRLGFSLQSAGEGSRHTAISAIYPDSVASRDGRLRPGDQLITVNDESVEGMNTAEVIDLLRKIRGSICITVWRKPASTVTSTQTTD